MADNMSTEHSPSYGGYSTQADHQQGPPRKKMRKGTKSCIECRRRKIKCTMDPAKASICNECHARGSTCIDQEHGDVSTITQTPPPTESANITDRVARIEDLLQDVLSRLPQQDSLRRDHVDNDDTQAAEVLKSFKSGKSRSTFDEMLLPGTASEAAPAISLFDNEVLARKQVEPTLSREQYNKAKTLNKALKQLLPPFSDLESILGQSQEWWTIWKQMYPDVSDQRCPSIKDAVSHSLRSEKPAEIGKVMLSIALGIHQLPPHFDWSSRLSIRDSPEELMERLVSAVDRLITSDEEIAATIEGIECMVLEAKWQTNMGRPRKSWLLTHKAIAYAQLIGLHRVCNQPPKDPADPTFKRKLNIWTHLVIVDRWLSMMMGLPYTIPESLVAPTMKMATSPIFGATPQNFVFSMVGLMGRIIDRNQNLASASYLETMAMEQQMEDTRNQTDRAWWTTERLPGVTNEKHFERLQAQFFHHQVRVCLHQPFMLKASSDTKYSYSHHATLDSARELIRYYDAIRNSDDVGSHACKVIDFQVFIAAMLLLLNLCGYSQANRGATPYQLDLDQDQQDSELIDRIITLLNNAANESGGVVAAHCAQALATLAKVRTGKCDTACKDGDSIQVSIPYFGRLSITPGNKFVPIKPGTYPNAGNSRPTQVPVNSLTGLPTPPSLGSALTSPRDSLIDASRPSPYWSTADSMAKGADQMWASNPDGSLVTFDHFMAFPSLGQIDFSSMDGSSTSGSGILPEQYGLGTITEGNLAAGYPFPMVNTGQVDLDQGWDWRGFHPPTTTM